MDVKLPDGTIIKNVPEGTTKAQLASKMRANGMKFPQEWLQPSAPAKAPEKPLPAWETEILGARDYLVPGLREKKLLEDYNRASYGLGGGVTDVASKLGASPSVAAGAGFATNLGMQALPAISSGGPVAVAAKPAMERAATKVMQSAIKPTLQALKSGDAKIAIEELLKRNISPNEAGVQVLKSRIGELDDQVQQLVDASKGTVKLSTVARSMSRAFRKFSNQVNRDADISALRKSWGEFKNTYFKTSNEISASKAHALKRGTYAALGDKPYQSLMNPASTEGEKAIAGGLREGVAQAVPRSVPLLEEESRLMKTLSVSERRALMEANKDPMGLALVAHDARRFAAFMANRSAAFKSLIARMLYRMPASIPASAARTVVGTGQAANQMLNNPSNE